MLSQRLQEGGECVCVGERGMIAEEVELAGGVRGGKPLAHQSPKQPRQHPHRQEETRPARDPARAVGRQGPRPARCNAHADDG